MLTNEILVGASKEGLLTWTWAIVNHILYIG